MAAAFTDTVDGAHGGSQHVVGTGDPAAMFLKTFSAPATTETPFKADDPGVVAHRSFASPDSSSRGPPPLLPSTTTAANAPSADKDTVCLLTAGKQKHSMRELASVAVVLKTIVMFVPQGMQQKYSP
jgi:hypothetical protein